MGSPDGTGPRTLVGLCAVLSSVTGARGSGRPQPEAFLLPPWVLQKSRQAWPGGHHDSSVPFPDCHVPLGPRACQKRGSSCSHVPTTIVRRSQAGSLSTDFLDSREAKTGEHGQEVHCEACSGLLPRPHTAGAAASSDLSSKKWAHATHLTPSGWQSPHDLPFLPLGSSGLSSGPAELWFSGHPRGTHRILCRLRCLQL